MKDRYEHSWSKVKLLYKRFCSFETDIKGRAVVSFQVSYSTVYFLIYLFETIPFSLNRTSFKVNKSMLEHAWNTYFWPYIVYSLLHYLSEITNQVSNAFAILIVKNICNYYFVRCMYRLNENWKYQNCYCLCVNNFLFSCFTNNPSNTNSKSF